MNSINLLSQSSKVKSPVKEKLLITVKEAAELLSIGPRTYYRLEQQNLVPPFVKIGRCTRVRLSEILAYIDALKVRRV